MQLQEQDGARSITQCGSGPDPGPGLRPGQGIETTVTIGELQVDVDREQVFIGNRPVHLTGTEYRILRALLMRSSAVIRRDALLSTVRSYTEHVSSQSLDGHISRLRMKLGPYGMWIRTFKGIGYRFFPHPPDDPPR